MPRDFKKDGSKILASLRDEEVLKVFIFDKGKDTKTLIVETKNGLIKYGRKDYQFITDNKAKELKKQLEDLEDGEYGPVFEDLSKSELLSGKILVQNSSQKVVSEEADKDTALEVEPKWLKEEISKGLTKAKYQALVNADETLRNSKNAVLLGEALIEMLGTLFDEKEFLASNRTEYLSNILPKYMQSIDDEESKANF